MTGWGSGGPHSGVPAEKPEILCGRTVRTLTGTLWILQAVSWATMHFFLIIPQNRSEQSLQGHGPGVTSQHWAIPAVPFSWKVSPQARHGNIAEVLWLSVSGTSPGRSQVMDGAGPPDDLPGASLEATACHSPSPPPTSSTKRESGRLGGSLGCVGVTQACGLPLGISLRCLSTASTIPRRSYRQP